MGKEASKHGILEWNGFFLGHLLFMVKEYSLDSSKKVKCRTG